MNVVNYITGFGLTLVTYDQTQQVVRIQHGPAPHLQWNLQLLDTVGPRLFNHLCATLLLKVFR